MRCAGGRGGQPRGPGAWRRSETDAGTMPSSCTKELSCFWVAGPPASPLSLSYPVSEPSEPISAPDPPAERDRDCSPSWASVWGRMS